MRKEFSKIAEEIIASNLKTVFITADLGFNALEGIREIAQERFINAGVAEQNMIGVAAGLAYKGHETFVYNIASFGVFRCFEQIKIDVCLHNLPVYIVGNGGGYGYGVMGATHHALEDIGCLSTLPNMICWIPAFSEDVKFCLEQITSIKKPAYLRLGLGENYPTKIKISSINQIVKSSQPEITIIALGPIVQNAMIAISGYTNIDLYTIVSIPIIDISDDLLESISTSKKIIVIEEHVERGGLGEHILSLLAKKTISYSNFVSLNAKGYPNNLYGDQQFHQKESGLDVESICTQIDKLLQK